MRWHLISKLWVSAKKKGKEKGSNTGLINNIGLFWSFLAQSLAVTMLEICILDFFYDHICIAIFNWGHGELRYVYNNKVLPIFQMQYPFIFDSFCVDKVSLSGIVYIEDIHKKMCKVNVLRKSSIFYFSLHCQDWSVMF